MASDPVIPRFHTGEFITAGQLNQLSDAVQSLQQKNEDPPAGGIPTTIAAAGLMLAGSKRKVSRRGLLGFGWFSRARL